MLLFSNIWMIKQLARTSVENELQGHKRQVSTGNKVHTYSHDICFRDGTISKQGIISNTEHRHNSAENVMSITAIFQPKSQILLGIVINIDLTLFLAPKEAVIMKPGKSGQQRGKATQVTEFHFLLNIVQICPKLKYFHYFFFFSRRTWNILFECTLCF